MRALIQKVSEAKVVVEKEIVGQISTGILVFLGIGHHDTLETGKKLIDKIMKYRIFNDENQKMGWNISQAQGSLLIVSQFTLMAKTQKGLRPDFKDAMPPQHAEDLYHQIVAYAKDTYPSVETGKFGADMQVSLVNDGPVTFNLEIE